MLFFLPKKIIIPEHVNRDIQVASFSLMYLVAPNTGFFGDKVVKSILHLRVCWNE